MPHAYSCWQRPRTNHREVLGIVPLKKEEADKKPAAKAEPVPEESKSDDSVKKDETNLDDKAE